MKYFWEEKKDAEISMRDSLDFPAHLHEHFEFGYLEEGSSVLVIEGKKHPIARGDFFLVFPNQIHSYEQSENIRVNLLIFSPLLIREFEPLFSSKIPATPIVSHAVHAQEIAALLLQANPNDMPTLKGFLLALFGLLTAQIPLAEIDKYNISTLKSLLLYCSEHFREGITVSDASNALHISRYHIAHIFREKLGTTFSDYITGKRIEYACRLLTDAHLSIAEVANQSGFNSLRSFNRHFLQQMECSPKAYRKKL